MPNHPCLSCGACCSFFRVSFHWSETLAESHGVPVAMTSSDSLHRSIMTGTEQANPRCGAFTGVVGEAGGSCSIYENRPGCCRNFKASFENGVREVRCDDARVGKGLLALVAGDWPAVTDSFCHSV